MISLAILADDDPNWRPSQYGYGRWGFKTGTEFPVVKLLDYAANWEALEASPNPFAVVVLAHLKTLETRKSPVDRQAWKIRLVKGLYARGFSAGDVRQLFRFIDWEEVNQYQQEEHMPFVSIAERVAREESLLEGIEVALKLKFADEGLLLMAELRELRDHEMLRSILRAIETAATPDELRRVWTRRRRPRKGRGT